MEGSGGWGGPGGRCFHPLADPARVSVLRSPGENCLSCAQFQALGNHWLCIHSFLYLFLHLFVSPVVTWDSGRRI